MDRWIRIGRAFSPWAVALLGCGSICTQGFALGWYRSAPLALEAIRRVWIFGSVTTSAFSQTDPLLLEIACGLGGSNVLLKAR